MSAHPSWPPASPLQLPGPDLVLRRQEPPHFRGVDLTWSVSFIVMAKMITGLKPRGFTWVIADRLAVSERIGGNGFQHRRVRREEEITWLAGEAGINAIVSLLPANQNVTAYAEAGLDTHSVPVVNPVTRADRDAIHATLDRALADPVARVLIHREVIDDSLAGVLGGYLLSSGLIDDPILAVAVIQEILGRALGPAGRSLIPQDGV
ncbi:hypothetical protein BH23ACT5_BH23ACT5_11470 [soil metagenome]